MITKFYKFDIYRYQLVPKKVLQLTVDDPDLTYEKVVAHKNEYFHNVIVKSSFTGRRGKLPVKIPYDKDNYSVLWIGNEKYQEIVEDFATKTVPTNPFSTIIIDNNPSSQILAISRNYKAFSDTGVIVRSLSEAINKELDYYNLVVHIEPITSKVDFWNMLKGKEGRVKSITFEIIKPNMSNISECLADYLKDFSQETNSHRTMLQINAPEDGVLEGINENSHKMQQLVDYSTNGGGTIKTKVLGDPKTYSTRDNIKTIEVPKGTLVEEMDENIFNSFVHSVISKITNNG